MKIDLKIKRHRKWFAIITTVLVAIIFSLLGIYVVEEYGIFLFFLIPFFLGFSPAILYNQKNVIKYGEIRDNAFISLGIYSVCLIAFAIEGLVCIVMAAPLAILFTWIGSLLGYSLIKRNPDNASSTYLIIIFALPAFSFLEKDSEPELTSVITSIEISANQETVWKNVVEFPKLNEPNEFIFKTGIAYPINASIVGKGVGAIRYCNFTTGSFVEPITIWDKPNLLKFAVEEQPAPLKEISFWDLDAPHLHDYFVSKQGQFKLTKLENGHTLLEGTTWYYHDIKPSFYWNIWSKYIVHKIHNRVLEHIKYNSENQSVI